MSRGRRRPWVKVWAHWYTRAEHLALSKDALALGAPLMILADTSWDKDTGIAQVTVSTDVISRMTHMTIHEVEFALEELISVETLERDEHGSIVWPAYGSEQETRQAASMRKRRETVTETGDTDVDTELPQRSEVRGQRDEKPKVKRKKREAKPPPEAAIEIAQYLYDAILEHDPGFMSGAQSKKIESTMMGWAHAIGVGIRNDGMTKAGSIEAIDSIYRGGANGWWCGKLLSGVSLRKHYEKLKLKAAQRTPSSTSILDGYDFNAAREARDAFIHGNGRK